MKPFCNLNDVQEFVEHCDGKFTLKFAPISDSIEAKKLGYNLSIVPPGKMVCPFHNLRINEEMFLTLEGEGLLRFGDKEHTIKQHDIIACPPGDRQVAHQIINTGKEDLKYLTLSTKLPYEIVEYPDSDKVLSDW